MSSCQVTKLLGDNLIPGREGKEVGEQMESEKGFGIPALVVNVRQSTVRRCLVRTAVVFVTTVKPRQLF